MGQILIFINAPCLQKEVLKAVSLATSSHLLFSSSFSRNLLVCHLIHELLLHFPFCLERINPITIKCSCQLIQSGSKMFIDCKLFHWFINSQHRILPSPWNWNASILAEMSLFVTKHKISKPTTTKQASKEGENNLTIGQCLDIN